MFVCIHVWKHPSIHSSGIVQRLGQWSITNNWAEERRAFKLWDGKMSSFGFDIQGEFLLIKSDFYLLHLEETAAIGNV